MKGSIRLSNGKVLRFNDQNYQEVIGSLTDKQRSQLANLLRDRLGRESPANEYGVDETVYHVWHELVHRKDVQRGGSSSSESKAIKGTKKLVRSWRDKGEAEFNILYLHRMGFKRRWDQESGYHYRHPRVGEVPLNWVYEIGHEEFKVRVGELINGGRHQEAT